MKRKKNDFINHPTFPGGLKAMRLFIQQNLVYPKAALDAKIQGKVFLKYVVDRNGNVIETKVIHGIGYGCDEEAIRIVKLFKFDVKQTRGLKIKHNKSIKIHFNLAQAGQAKVQQSAKSITHISYITTTQTPGKQEKGGYGYEIELWQKKNC